MTHSDEEAPCEVGGPGSDPVRSVPVAGNRSPSAQRPHAAQTPVVITNPLHRRESSGTSAFRRPPTPGTARWRCAALASSPSPPLAGPARSPPAGGQPREPAARPRPGLLPGEPRSGSALWPPEPGRDAAPSRERPHEALACKLGPLPKHTKTLEESPTGGVFERNFE